VSPAELSPREFISGAGGKFTYTYTTVIDSEAGGRPPTCLVTPFSDTEQTGRVPASRTGAGGNPGPVHATGRTVSRKADGGHFMTEI
jgi:hypothetical protein